MVVRPPFRCEYGTEVTIGAGAVVTRDLPAGVVAGGTPARICVRSASTTRIDVPDR